MILLRDIPHIFIFLDHSKNVYANWELSQLYTGLKMETTSEKAWE